MSANQLRAGQKARGSNAYAAALTHFISGLELADAGSDPRLLHELGVRRIEAMYLCGRFEEAERLAGELLDRITISEMAGEANPREPGGGAKPYAAESLEPLHVL